MMINIKSSVAKKQGLRFIYGGVHGFDGGHGRWISESKPRASLKSGKSKLTDTTKTNLVAA